MERRILGSAIALVAAALTPQGLQAQVSLAVPLSARKVAPAVEGMVSGHVIEACAVIYFNDLGEIPFVYHSQLDVFRLGYIAGPHGPILEERSIGSSGQSSSASKHKFLKLAGWPMSVPKPPKGGAYYFARFSISIMDEFGTVLDFNHESEIIVLLP